MKTIESFPRLRYMDINTSKIDTSENNLIQPLPSVVYIEPTNFCNFLCPFCPLGNQEKNTDSPNKMMDMKVYEKIILNLKELVFKHDKKIDKIQLYKYGEPLLHPDFSQMVKMAKEADIAHSIETTTNGSIISPRLAEEILEAGLDVIRISVEHIEDDYYKGLSRGRMTYSTIKDKVRKLHSLKMKGDYDLHIHVKILGSLLSNEQIERFITDYMDIADSWNVDAIMPAKDPINNDYIKLSKLEDSRIVCYDIFNKLNINYDGTISTCCVDWCYEIVVGDVNVETVEEIWNGKRFNDFRVKHLQGKRCEIEKCATCDYIGVLPNIDEKRESMLPFY